MGLPSLAGKTVAIIGNAPNMSAAHCPPADYTIAASSGLVHAPNADAHIAIDGNMPIEGYTGLRLVGVPEIEGARYAHMPYDAVEVAPGHVVHIRNNTLSAIRLAAWAGATNITVAGHDAAAYNDAHNFPWLEKGLTALIVEFAMRDPAVRVDVLPPPVRALPKKK